MNEINENTGQETATNNPTNAKPPESLPDNNVLPHVPLNDENIKQAQESDVEKSIPKITLADSGVAYRYRQLIREFVKDKDADKHFESADVSAGIVNLENQLCEL